MAEARKTAKIGNFELLERIGQGGMGTVFKARQLSMDRIVAVKVLPPSLAKQATFIERFVREAKASAKLNHPNVVGGIDVGQDNGIYYFAMEYVDGPSAKDMLAKAKFSEEQVLRIGKAMAEALAHAHAQGILHRDMKPDNVLIDRDGTPKLCDLGLARLETENEAQKHLTQQGQAVGTPHYISPEQARGQRDLDAKCDLYSLGATLYHMLTGKTMYDGATSVVVMSKHISEKCPNPNDLGAHVSKGLVAILAKLLAKDRADRYESAAVLAEDFGRVIRGKPPRHAELAPAKSPFSGGAVPSGPVKKATSVPAAEKLRSQRRETRTTDAVKSATWLLPGLAVLLLAALGLILSTGNRPTSSDDPKASSSGREAGPAKGATPPAVAVATLPPKVPSPRVAPQTDALGFRKPSETVLRVPPKAEPIGFASRPVGEQTPATATQAAIGTAKP
ncbi:MAG: protein kinase, partial [Planctomycetota bacterium]|nr:protein kinase [Planctomycetota bacterium]